MLDPKPIAKVDQPWTERAIAGRLETGQRTFDRHPAGLVGSA